MKRTLIIVPAVTVMLTFPSCAGLVFSPPSEEAARQAGIDATNAAAIQAGVDAVNTAAQINAAAAINAAVPPPPINP